MIDVTISTRSGPKVVSARSINARWCAHRHDTFDRWTLTHRPTGYSAGIVRTFTIAQRLARAFDKKFTAKRWEFTDPSIAITFKGARTIAEKYEAL